MPARLAAILFVSLLVSGGAGQAAGGQARAGQAGGQAGFPRVQKLAPNVYSYEQLRSSGAEQFTTVSLFVVTADGVLVADGQGSVAETRRMVEEIGKITPQPIRHVVICSDHGDHTGGNAAFPADAAYYVHPTSKATLESGTAKLPASTTVVADRETLRLGGTEIQILFLGRAHTGGDLSVYLPKENVLFMSEAFLNRVFPAMRSAYPSEWVATIERAQKMNAAVYVPGHGFVESPAVLKQELEIYRRAVVQVIAEARRLHAAGVPVEQAITQARFGDLESWTIRASQAPIAIRRVYLELDGKIK